MRSHSVYLSCCACSRQKMAHFLRSRRCSDLVCFLGVFCRGDKVGGMALHDPQCMDRRCVAREIGEGGVIWSCANVSGLWVERIWVLAIMEVSARAILLGDKPRSGCWGHQFSHTPGRPLLHFFLSLSQTSVGNGCATCCRCPFLLFECAGRPARSRWCKSTMMKE